jgi:hypothetical protein
VLLALRWDLNLIRGLGPLSEYRAMIYHDDISNSVSLGSRRVQGNGGISDNTSINR